MMVVGGGSGAVESSAGAGGAAAAAGTTGAGAGAGTAGSVGALVLLVGELAGSV